METKLYIMTGRSFAGKSTLTKELVKRFGFSVASVDWNIDKYSLDIRKMTQDNWNLVYSQAYERLEGLLREGKTVVLDLGNLEKSERDTARNIANEVGVSCKLIYIEASLDEVRKRWKENLEKKGGRRMDEESFNKAQKMWN